jgi:ketosteroid isomerase-like protein
MSEENVEIVRKAYEAFDHGDLTTLLAHFDPEVVSYTASPLPDPMEHVGHEGILQWIDNWTGAFEEFEMEPTEYIDLGDKVIVCALQRATGAASGVPVEQTFWFLQVLRNGTIVRIGIHATEDQALEAAGLSE